jgi:DNA-directed RNA polymerase subunit beta'
VLRPLPDSGLGAAPGRGRGDRPEGGAVVQTTAGRLFFNEALPVGFAYVNDVVGKRNIPIGTIVEDLAANYPKHVVAASLDRIKALGFRFAAQSG